MSIPADSTSGYHRRRAEEFAGLSRTILRLANQGIARSDFTREVLSELLSFSGADETSIRVNEGSRFYCATLRNGEPGFRFEMARREGKSESDRVACANDSPGLTELCRIVIEASAEPGLPWFTRSGSFLTGDTSEPVGSGRVHLGVEFRSTAIIRFAVDERSHGLVLLWSRQAGFFSLADVEFYEAVVQTIGVALADRRAQAAWRERVKELTCLYGIDEVQEQPDLGLPERLQAIVELLPPAWLYPEIAAARIMLDGVAHTTHGFRAAGQSMSADIIVKRQPRGRVELVYMEPRPTLDEGPFLRDERKLIDAVATKVAGMLERQLVEEEHRRLEAQLRHADRLATIGQLAAGVAHELNEPVGNVLGFAQLLAKSPGLPGPARDDVEKIVVAALHARAVVSKLMLFARQKMPAHARVKLNELVDNGLYFLEARCAKAGIKIERRLAADLPEIAADSGQLYQVLVNLVVNAIQAMAAGGTLTIATATAGDDVALEVRDTGTGMTDDVKSRIFLPFFTTKDVGEGTGLGLPVVHGIVTAHGGRIEVESAPGQGTVFRVLLPIAGPPAEGNPS